LLGDLDPAVVETRAIRDPVDQSRQVFDEVYERVNRCVRGSPAQFAPLPRSRHKSFSSLRERHTPLRIRRSNRSAFVAIHQPCARSAAPAPRRIVGPDLAEEVSRLY